MTSLIDINAKYFNDVINNIDNVINNNYKIKRLGKQKYETLKSLLIIGNNNNAVKYDIKINIQIMELLNNQLNKTMKLINEYYNKIDSKIKTIPGIGSLTGSVILSYIGDIKRFDSVIKLRAYAGMICNKTVREL